LKPVGIIANPASGKDIRRLVAYGSVFGNMEKINIIKRLLMGLDSVGVEEAFLMPDFDGLGIRALEDVRISLSARLLEMEAEGTQDDSTLASEMLAQMGAACIITLGGDGTNRVVAKGCGDTPILPISTGTNNVFPFMVEGTLAGIAAGVMAVGGPPVEKVCRRVPRLEIRREGELLDIALIDLVVSERGFVGARALWEVEKIKEIFLARAQPDEIGFSSVGGFLCPLSADGGKGLHMVIGPGGKRVKAPIAPGLIRWVPIRAKKTFRAGEEIPISHTPCIVALDGEREMTVSGSEQLSVSLNPDGPLVVELDKVFSAPGTRRFFVED